MRGQLGRLRNHGGIDIADLIARLAHAARSLAQQHAAVGAGKARVGIGEMAADVAQRGRAEQRVSHRVQQRVGIGMAQQAAVMRDFHAAKDQLAAGHQRVDVIALAHADIERHHCSYAPYAPVAPVPSSTSASAKSSG
ncbi:hypothetical protein D9M70_525640 [compost metagenome]